MSKRAITWTIIIGVVVILILGGWWFFNKTKSIISQAGIPAANVKSSDTSITAFTFSGINLDGNEKIDNANHTVQVFVPYGTDVTDLTPVISVGGFATVAPQSGVMQNFTGPITYTVTAQDGLTQQYLVTVEVLSNPATSAGS